MSWENDQRSAVEVLKHAGEARGSLTALAAECGLKPAVVQKIVRHPTALCSRETALPLQKATRLPLLCLMFDKHSPVARVLDHESVRQSAE